MAFEKIKENTEDLKEEVKNLIDANLKYYKLLSFKILMESITMLLRIFILAIMLMIVIVFFSIALALGIGYWLDNFAYGFLIVGGIYLVMALVVYYTQDKIVEGAMLSRFSKIFFKED